MKFIKGALILFLLSMVFYLGIFFTLNKITVSEKPLIYSLNYDLVWEGGNSYDRFREFDESRDFDVLVMGSSHAYRGFDPRIFKKEDQEMFNLGSSSQSLIDTEILFDELVNKEHVKLVILEISPMSFSGDSYESTAYLVANIPNDDIAFKLVRNRADMKGFNLYTQRLFRKLEDKPLFESSDYIGNGYCEKFDSLNSDITYSTFKNYSPKEEYVDALINIVSKAKERKINLLLVTQPLPIETDHTIFAEFHNVIKTHAEDYGVTYLDYTFSLPLDSKDHFYDHSHLNQSGVNIFNERLLKDLKDLNLMPE
ncbi:MAG: hypothetical protein ACI8XB_002197 [Patiriisocius sp.]|jgi:hypothetical protein